MFPFSFLLKWLFPDPSFAPGFTQAGSAAAEELPRGGKRLYLFYILSHPS